MENFFPHRGKRAENACFQPVPGCWFGAVERSTPRSGCGVGCGPGSRPRGRKKSHSGETGARRAERGFGWGLLKYVRGLRDRTAEGRRPDPSPERACAVGTVTGAVMSPRLAGRTPKASGPEFFAQRKGSGRVAGGLAAPSGAVFRAKLRRGGHFRPQSDRF